jgi:hypothetical protein
MMRRISWIAAILVLGAMPAMAQASKGQAKTNGGEEEEVERKIVGGGKIAAGWTAKVDRDGPIAKVKLEAAANGAVHIETAASAVFYRPADKLSRNYHLAATFTQQEASPGHAEPYGLIFGGELRGDTLDYTYFMIQADGKFSVRRRTGDKSKDLGNGWMENKAIQQADAKGTCTNRLMIERTPNGVRFMINGTEVFKAPPDSARPDGISGVRVSHNLSVDVSGAMRMQM